MKKFALCVLIFTAAACFGGGVDWVRAGMSTNESVWGIRGGLLWAIAPAGFRGGEPRGLIRLGYPVLPGNGYDLINFIAVEPVVGGRRGFSELERSQIDNLPGKRIRAEPAGPAGAGPGQLVKGPEGYEELQVDLRVERFANGTHVRLRLVQRSDRPDELQLSVFSQPDSAPLEYCILTATMGNMARARQLWLKDEVVSSLEVYADYKDKDFTRHKAYPLDRLHRTPTGRVLVITNDEKDPKSIYPFPNSNVWHYAGRKVTQYWAKEPRAFRDEIQAVVNGRYTYWQSSRPIPGGVAFENFEFRERFYEGHPSSLAPLRKGLRSLGFRMITIDGSHGEGGGQILRTSLALSLVTGHPFRMERVRARRQRPGLLRQHLTAVEAARAVGCADVDGAALNSQTLEFKPGPVTPGNYRFAVGTAGSATLVLQTVLPPLLMASGPSILTLEGGTHNPMAPPFDFLARCFAPLLYRMGTRVQLELVRPGFYPAGGGQFHARIEPGAKLSRLDLLERGAIHHRQARVLISRLPAHVAEREIAVLGSELKWRDDEYTVETVSHPVGPGNAVVLTIEAEHVTEVVAAIGERGRRAEEVAMSAVEKARAWLDAGVPVDEHLADQLLIPMALAGAGAFRTTRPSLHTTTNAEVIQHFLAVTIHIEQESEIVWRIDVGRK